MAASHYANRPANLKTEQFDMDSFFDFNQSTTQPSPATASSSKVDSAISPYDQEERQHFSGPSHDYNQYKQQVGLPAGSMANLPPQSMFDGYGSGIGDMGYETGFNGSWSSGIDLDTDMNMDFNNPQSAMPPMFFPPPTNDSQNDFVNPNTIGGQEEPTSNVGRLWPGMHSQQAQHAAMQKAAQVQAVQQRQMKLQAQHAQYRQVPNAPQSQSQGSSQQSHAHSSKPPSHVTEPHVEESISRLLNQMRNNSSASDGDDGDSPGNSGQYLSKMKKDEEEMDEDERLLASEEGKKLSSKERRQLRNKVSARAFRSRRKEYIGQLEGEVAMKNQEANNLRSENSALMAENDRYRGLIETLLRHPAFTPFINDISKDPSVFGMPQRQPQQQQQQQQQRPSVTPTPQHPQPQQQQQQQQETKPEYLNFDASQLQVPQPEQQQQQQQQVGLAMIPENDFSKLNINGFNSMNFNNFQRVNAFAVTEVPTGPDPVDLLIESPARLPCSSSDFATVASNTTCDSAAPCDADLTVLLAKLDGAASRIRALDTGN